MRDPSLRLLVLLVATPAAIAALVLGVPALESYLDDLTNTYEGFSPGVGEAFDWLVKTTLLALLLAFLVHMRKRAARKARAGSSEREHRASAQAGRVLMPSLGVPALGGTAPTADHLDGECPAL